MWRSQICIEELNKMNNNSQPDDFSDRSLPDVKRWRGDDESDDESDDENDEENDEENDSENDYEKTDGEKPDDDEINGDKNDSGLLDNDLTSKLSESFVMDAISKRDVHDRKIEQGIQRLTKGRSHHDISPGIHKTSSFALRREKVKRPSSLRRSSTTSAYTKDETINPSSTSVSQPEPPFSENN